MSHERPQETPPERRPLSRVQVSVFAVELIRRNPDGSIRSRDLLRNKLFNKFELELLRFVGRQQNNIGGTLYGRLYNDTPDPADGLPDLTGEPQSNGYASLAWPRTTVYWSDAATVGHVGQISGTQQSFTAIGAGYGPVTHLVLTTTPFPDNSGIPVGFFALPDGPITVTPGDPLEILPYIQLQGVRDFSEIP